MKARHIWAVAGVVLALLAVIGGVIGWAASGDDQADAQPVTAGAQRVVDAISQKWPAPNPRDNSSGCKAKAEDTGSGCVSRVTTDAVTVTEYADEATAKRAAGLGKAGGARQAGRYVLSWTGEQDVTSDEARADMVRIASGITG